MAASHDAADGGHVGNRAVRPLTADEVLRMVELGVLSEDEHAVRQMG